MGVSQLYTPSFADPHYALERPSGRNVTRAAGPGTPTALALPAAGYEKGATFQDVTNGALYLNTGTTTVAVWTQMVAAAGTTTLTGAVTASGAWVFSSTVSFTGAVTSSGGFKISDGGGTPHYATIAAATQAADRTYTIPDAGGAASFVLTAGNQTIAGTQTFSGGLLVSGATVGLGYTTGAGGVITQASNRSTGVTLNTLSGQITTNNASLAAAAFADFAVTNSAVAATDAVVVSIKPGGTGSPVASVVNIAAGTFTVRVLNQHAATADTSADVINFVVLKGASS